MERDIQIRIQLLVSLQMQVGIEFLLFMMPSNWEFH